MTQEEIEKAADEYVNEACRPLWRTGYEQVCKVDFMQGANWRINSVWHDMSEDPKRECMLALHGYGKTVIFNWNGDIKWKDIGKFFRAEEWAYIEDFLPNKEE